MKVAVLALLAALVVLTEYTSPVHSACCHPKRITGRGKRALPAFVVPALLSQLRPQCCDGTKGTPYCGYGKCNVFGCNCNGGCRRGHLCNGRKKRSTEEEASEALAQFDEDGDGAVSLEEVRSSMARDFRQLLNEVPTSQLDRDFADVDLDGDGIISLYEVDSSA